jgi:hypothetical protein
VEIEETQPTRVPVEEIELDSRQELRLIYESADAVEKDFGAGFGHAALFVESDGAWQPGQAVRICLDLRFCGREVRIQGLVVAVRPPGLGAAGAVPGVSLQLQTPVASIRYLLQEATGVALATAERVTPEERRGAPRSPAHGVATLVVEGAQFPAEMLNVSYEGMLALLHGLDLGLGSDVNVILKHPQRGEEISIDSRIVNQTRCDHGKMAIGIQFQYPARRIDAVMAFIDDLQSLERAKKLAEVSGCLDDAPLENVIETLTGASSEGTFRLTRGDEEGILIHQDGQILHAATGLVSGMKAVSRVLLWREGRFAYQAAIEPFETKESPIPIEVALLEATVHRDEVGLLGIERFHPDDSFCLNEELMNQIGGELGEIHQEVAEHIRMDFPLGAILDILIQGDGVIYKALADLLHSGVVTPE